MTLPVTSTVLPPVLLLTDSDVFAGTERHMLDLARGLRDCGTTVLLACPTPSALEEHGKSAGLPIVTIPKGGLLDGTAIRILSDLLRDGKAAILHAHNGRTALSAAVAAKRTGAGCCVLTQHFLKPARAKRRGVGGQVYALAHRWVSRNTHGFIAISEAVADSMQTRGDAPQERVRVVLNGITDPGTFSNTMDAADTRLQLGIPQGAALVVCAARLEREKNVETLINAMALLQRSHPHVICCIAGDGDERSTLQAHIHERKLQGTVRLLGFRNDVLSLLQAADVFVLPSLAEPFGLVLLEAMAFSKPVVATNVGGPREIVVHEETGLLVSPQNADTLAQALGRLIGAPETARRMGIKGRQRYETHFTAGRMARETIQVYENALSFGPTSTLTTKHSMSDSFPKTTKTF